MVVGFSFLSISISLKCFWHCNIFCRNDYACTDYILSAEPYASKNLYICINFNDIPKLGLNNEEHHIQIDMSVLDIIWTSMTNIVAGYWYLFLNHFLLLFYKTLFPFVFYEHLSTHLPVMHIKITWRERRKLQKHQKQFQECS